MPTSPPVSAGRPHPPDAIPVLDVRQLRVSFRIDEGWRRAVDDVSVVLQPGRTVGLIGESGAGKSVTARAVMQLLPPHASVTGRVLLDQHGTVVDVLQLDPRSEEMRQIRGRTVAMVFQEANASLSPVHTVGGQLTEAIQLHRNVDRRTALELAAELLDRVGVPSPRVRLHDYPHQLSGGLAQRVALALALCGEPRVLIADEPTSGVDAAVQVQLVELLHRLQAELGMAVLFITHDLTLAGELCHTIAVMYLGQIVEQAPSADVLRRPLHPYTSRLVEASPRFGARRDRLPTIPGRVPTLPAVDEGCRFIDRCDADVTDRCRQAVPELVEVEPGRLVRCVLHRPGETRLPG